MRSLGLAAAMAVLAMIVSSAHAGEEYAPSPEVRALRESDGLGIVLTARTQKVQRWSHTQQMPHPRAHTTASPATTSREAHIRMITSATDMRFLRIPRAMAEALIPDIKAFASIRNTSARPACSGRPVFASHMLLIDADDQYWPVLFRTYSTGKQYHRRLSGGWGRFATSQGLNIGDTVLFLRQDEDERQGSLVLRVRVVRGVA